MVQHTKKSPYIIGCLSRPPHLPPQQTSPLKTPPFSTGGLYLGLCVFPTQRKIADAFGDKFGNGIMALSAFLGGFACAFGLGSLEHPWMEWMDGWQGGMGLGWLQPWVWWNFHHHPLPKNKLRKLIVSRERESWKPFFWGGWGGVLS